VCVCARERYHLCMGIYDRNDGQPGVVYILVNEALKDGIYKIGQSTRSGRARASELNSEGKTGMPKMYRCVYEVSTCDCGRAEKMVHARLSRGRLTKQEFFRVDLEEAKRTIHEVIAELERRPVEDIRPVRRFSSMKEVHAGMDVLTTRWARERERRDTVFNMKVAIPLVSLFIAIVYATVMREDAMHGWRVFAWLCGSLELLGAFNLWQLTRKSRAADAPQSPHPEARSESALPADAASQ